jgi:hypothetical protein
MKRLVYCLPSAINTAQHQDFPGVKRFSQVYKLYGKWVTPFDRTLVMKTPIRDVPIFPVPQFRTLTKSFAELVDERAIQILRDSEKWGKDIYILYSGGIDSSATLVALLKHATPEQKQRIVVLLSHECIAENPRLFNEHIAGKLRTGSSFTFPEKLGGDNYFVSGEHSDMVMGSDKIGKMITQYGVDSLHEKYNRDRIAEFFAEDSFKGDREMAHFYLDIFERIVAKAPMPIVNNMEFLWWVNFAIKWHACFYYMLLFTPARNAPNVTQEYLDTRFISFFNTEEFQLWAMNNTDKRIKDTWKSYKWVIKDYIYEYTKDAEYRDNKTKRGSLLLMLGFDPPHRFIDEHLQFHTTLPMDEYLQAENDFV